MKGEKCDLCGDDTSVDVRTLSVTFGRDEDDPASTDITISRRCGSVECAALFLEALAKKLRRDADANIASRVTQ
jgi:hypothetical protein